MHRPPKGAIPPKGGQTGIKKQAPPVLAWSPVVGKKLPEKVKQAPVLEEDQSASEGIDYIATTPIQYFQQWRCPKCNRIDTILNLFVCKACKYVNAFWFSNPHLAQLFVQLVNIHIPFLPLSTDNESNIEENSAPPVPAENRPNPSSEVTVVAEESPIALPPPSSSLGNGKKISEPIPKGISPSTWSCNKCTYLNKPTLMECEICGEKKKEMAVVVVESKSFDKNEEKNNDDEIKINKSDSISPIPIPINNSLSNTQTWACSTCTLENKKKSLRCSACGTERNQSKDSQLPIPLDPSSLSMKQSASKSYQKKSNLTDIKEPNVRNPALLSALFPLKATAEKEITKKMTRALLERELDEKKSKLMDDESESDSEPGAAVIQKNPNHRTIEKGRISLTDWNEKKKDAPNKKWRCPVCQIMNTPNRQICKNCKNRTIHLYRLRLRHGLEDASQK